MSSPTSDPRRTIQGWKAISEELGVSIKTAQNYKKLKGLPVRYVDSHPVLVATDLDNWRRSRLAASALLQEPAPSGPSDGTLYGRRWNEKSRSWLSRSTVAWVALVGMVVLIMGTAVSRSNWREPSPLLHMPDRLFAHATSEGGGFRQIRLEGRRLGTPHLAPEAAKLYFTQGDSSSPVVTIDTAKFQPSSELPVGGQPLSIGFSPDGALVYVGTSSDGLYIFDSKTSRRVDRVRDGLESEIRDIAVAPDGARIYLAMYRGGLRRYDVETGRVSIVSRIPCPWRLRMHPSGKQLFVSYQCGGPGGDEIHNAIDILELPSERSIRTLRTSTPYIGGGLTLLPEGDKLWTDGGDACTNQHYLKTYGSIGCPFAPGSIHYIFRVPDGSLLKVLGTPLAEQFGAPSIGSDGKRVVIGGTPLRVIETAFFQEVERFSPGAGQFESVLDLQHGAMFLAKTYSDELYRIDLPAGDCDPSQLGLVHHWAGDGTPGDRTGDVPLGDSQAEYSPGLIGQAFNISRKHVTAKTLYYTLFPASMREGTLSFWVKRTAQQPGVIAELSRGEMAAWKLGIDTAGRLSYEQLGRTVAYGKAGIQLGRWVQVVLIRSNDKVRIYQDGQLEIAADLPSLTSGPTSLIPTSLTFGPLAALVDEVALADRVYVEAELAEMRVRAQNCVWGPKKNSDDVSTARADRQILPDKIHP